MSRGAAAVTHATGSAGCSYPRSFTLAAISTPTITAYRAYLQTVLGLRPATINRHLVSQKRYCGWAVEAGVIARDPARVVKLIPRTPQAPRHLTDQEEEEQALVAAVSQHGSLRDRTLLVLALHTGLRAEELCRLSADHVHLGRRSGHLEIPSRLVEIVAGARSGEARRAA